MDIKGIFKEAIEIFKKDYLIGLDIGSSSIKLAQFAMKPDGLHLINLALEEVIPANDEAQTLAALKKILRGVDTKKSKIIVGINCPHTAIKKITAPYMPKTELREAVRLEAKNHFPFSIDNHLLDFEIVNEVLDKDVKKYELLVATSPLKTINKYLSLLDKIGIKPTSFTPFLYALQKVAGETYKNGINCFIDIGDSHTELVISKARVLLFSRKIPVSGSDFTKAMTMVLVSDRGRTGLSLDEAEKIKREVGIPIQDESKLIDNKISTTQILSMLRAPLDQLKDEIDRCFDYYREESKGMKIDKVALFGRGSFLKGLSDFLSEELGIEVKLGDPLTGLKVDPLVRSYIEKAGYSSQFAMAIGLALSKDEGINLLPAEIREETKRMFKRATIQALAAAVILILAFLYIGMKIQLSNFHKEISASQMELLSLQPQLKEAEARLLANRVLTDEPYWEDLFKELSNIIPKGIHLTELSMKDGLITMKGIISLKEAQRSLSNFILVLEKGIFKNVQLVTTKELKEKASSEFELKCWVD